MDVKAVSLLESYFDFLYAREISNTIYSVMKRECVGCQEGYLSQREHSCLSESKTVQLELYFDETVKLIDEPDILRGWYGNVTCLDISPELIAMYKLKIECKDWRDTEMKTGFWKRKMIRMATDIIKLENRFV